jgi:16S rRNA (guanine(966)-N(2))-methyltransferase RsmD
MELRPTSDRVREALFDILARRVVGARFLDAFAGTGAVGIEALSRGAGRVIFVERDRRARRIIEMNLTVGEWGDRHEIIGAEVDDALRRLTDGGSRVDILFSDPPYDKPEAAGHYALLAGLLDPGGILAIEHRSSAGVELGPVATWRSMRTYRYGDTALTVARLPATASSS